MKKGGKPPPSTEGSAGVSRYLPVSTGGCFREIAGGIGDMSRGIGRLAETKGRYVMERLKGAEEFTAYGMGEGRGVRFAPYDYGKYMEALDEPKRPEWDTPVRLKKGCPCWKVYDRANGVMCCVSYDTVVSIVRGGRVVRLGKWSMTTSRHQRLFEDSFR